MDEYLDVEEACVKGRSGQFVHGDMDGDREGGGNMLDLFTHFFRLLCRLSSSFHFDDLFWCRYLFELILKCILEDMLI